jgi:hypothetical protein
MSPKGLSKVFRIVSLLDPFLFNSADAHIAGPAFPLDLPDDTMFHVILKHVFTGSIRWTMPDGNRRGISVIPFP